MVKKYKTFNFYYITFKYKIAFIFSAMKKIIFSFFLKKKKLYPPFGPKSNAVKNLKLNITIRFFFERNHNSLDEIRS